MTKTTKHDDDLTRMGTTGSSTDSRTASADPKGCGRCLAEEWQCDGRGLWAMRVCQCAPQQPQHGPRHQFSAWRYNAKPSPAPEVLDVLRELVSAGEFAASSNDDLAIMLRLGAATDAARAALAKAEHGR